MFWKFQPECHVSSHGGSDSYPDLNNYEHAVHWGQEWNTGDADTSGRSDGELCGLQKVKGAKGKEGSFNGICCNCGSQVIRPSSVTQRVEKQKERDRDRKDTAKVGMTVKVGQSERDGHTVFIHDLSDCQSEKGSGSVSL